MNARLIKETREVAPMLGGALLVIVLPYLIWRANAEAIGYVAFGLACAALAGGAFGNEFQHRTVSLLLSQPIARSVVWREKMIVLGAGLAATATVVMICLRFCDLPTNLGAALLGITLTGLCAFCGGPYWTLVLRNGLTGIVAAAAAPIGIVIMASYVSQRFGQKEEVAMTVATILILLHCGVVYWLGYRKFQRLEVVDSPSRELALPSFIEAALTRPLTALTSRWRGAFATLVKKEFRLQQASFLLAAGYFLVAVAGFCLYLRYRELGKGVLIGDHLFYMIILPLIAGAICLGEERGWGLAEWHLTLPPGAGRQWEAKMLVTLSTSMILGLLLPAIMFIAGALLLGKPAPSDPLQSLIQVCGWAVTQLLVTSMAVYAATFARTTLWAILSAALMLCAAGGVAWLTGIGVREIGPVPFGWLGHPKVVAAMITPFFPWVLLLLLWLVLQFAWSNFRRNAPSPRRLCIQFGLILLSLWLTFEVWFSVLSLA